MTFGTQIEWLSLYSYILFSSFVSGNECNKFRDITSVNSAWYGDSGYPGIMFLSSFEIYVSTPLFCYQMDFFFYIHFVIFFVIDSLVQIKVLILFCFFFQ